MYEIKSRRLRSIKVVIVEEKLVGVDINDTVNLQDALRLVEQACWDLKGIINLFSCYS